MAKKPADTGIKVVMRDPRTLVPYPGNAKMHPEPQVGHIKESIKQFGFVNPILIDSADNIIAGHGRHTAALELALAKVPTITLSHLSEAQVKALRIADNAIPEGGIWSPELLEAELASLRAVKFDLTPLGIDQIEIPEVEDQIVAPPPRANRSKTTIFVSVRNEDVIKANKTIAAALDKAKIAHNL